MNGCLTCVPGSFEIQPITKFLDKKLKITAFVFLLLK